MKARILILSPLLLLAACKKDSSTTTTTTPVPEKTPPVATAVPDEALPPPPPLPPERPLHEVHVASGSLPPRAVDVPPPPVAVEVPDDVAVDEDEDAARTPGEHLDHAIQKTDEGIRQGISATGKFLERAGEKIEDKARENAPPPAPRPRQ